MKAKNLKHCIATIMMLIFIQLDISAGFASVMELDNPIPGCDPECRWIVPVLPTGWCTDFETGGTGCTSHPNFPWELKNCTGTFYPLCDPV